MCKLLKRRKLICQMLKTNTASKVAIMFGVSTKQMQKFIERNCISVIDLKKAYAKDKLSKLNQKYTIKEMVELTGFSRNKVTRLMVEFGIQSKFSNQKLR